MTLTNEEISAWISRASRNLKQAQDDYQDAVQYGIKQAQDEKDAERLAHNA